MSRIDIEAPLSIKGSLVPSKNGENVKNFIELTCPSFGEKVLLVGEVSNYGKYLKKIGTDVKIMEKDQRDIDEAMMLNDNCDVIKGSPEYIPFNDEYFDKVVFLNCFNSFYDEKKVLKEIYRVLKSEGQILIEEKNMEVLSNKIGAMTNKLFKTPGCKFYYPQEVIQKFKRLGFNGVVEKVSKTKFIYLGTKNS